MKRVFQRVLAKSGPSKFNVLPSVSLKDMLKRMKKMSVEKASGILSLNCFQGFMASQQIYYCDPTGVNEADEILLIIYLFYMGVGSFCHQDHICIFFHSRVMMNFRLLYSILEIKNSKRKI